MPDINHQSSNIDKGLVKATGLEGMAHADAKTLFLQRFRHGPHKKGALSPP